MIYQVNLYLYSNNIHCSIESMKTLYLQYNEYNVNIDQQFQEIEIYNKTLLKNKIILYIYKILNNKNLMYRNETNTEY